MDLLDVTATLCELGALAAAVAALVWAALLLPAPWAGPAVVAAAAVGLVTLSWVLTRIAAGGEPT